MGRFGCPVRVVETAGNGSSGCPGHTLCSVDPNPPAGPFQPPARRTTARLLVPDECRKWARASGVPLHDLLQCFVDLGASVLELIPVGSGVVPSLAQLLSVVSVVPPDSPLGDRSTRPSEPLVAPPRCPSRPAVLGAGRAAFGNPHRGVSGRLLQAPFVRCSVSSDPYPARRSAPALPGGKLCRFDRCSRCRRRCCRSPCGGPSRCSCRVRSGRLTAPEPVVADPCRVRSRLLFRASSPSLLDLC